jgi:hypothetical protein
VVALVVIVGKWGWWTVIIVGWGVMDSDSGGCGGVRVVAEVVVDG